MPVRHLSGLRRAAAVALASLLTAAAAGAQTPLTSGNFYTFYFGGVGSSASGQPFTFTSANPFSVTLLDGYSAGDQFQLFAGATLIGSTTFAAPNSGISCSDPTACLADTRWSRGTFQLAAGSYSFRIVTTASPFGTGAAWIGVNVDDAPPPVGNVVPEPGTWALLGTGLVGLAAVARRRQRAVA